MRFGKNSIVLPEFYKGRIELISYDEASRRLYAAPFTETVCVMRGSGYIIYLPSYNGEIELIPYATAVQREIPPRPEDVLTMRIFWRNTFEQNRVQDASLLDLSTQSENSLTQNSDEPKKHSMQTRARAKTPATKTKKAAENTKRAERRPKKMALIDTEAAIHSREYSAKKVFVIDKTGYVIANVGDPHTYEGKTEIVTNSVASTRRNVHTHSLYNQTRETQLYVVPGTGDLVDPEKYLKRTHQEPESIAWDEVWKRRKAGKTLPMSEKWVRQDGTITDVTATEKNDTQAQKRGHESNDQDVAPPAKKRKTKPSNNATTNNETTTLHHPYVTNQQATNPLTLFGHAFAQTSVSLDTNNVEHHSSHVSNAINCAVNNNDQGELFFDLELDINNVVDNNNDISNAINCVVNGNAQEELYFDLEREELVFNSTSWW